MANNYTIFSFAIRINPDERGEIADFMVKFEETLDEWIGFDSVIEPNQIWIYTEESGNPDNVAAFLQAYIQRFDSTAVIGFHWSHSCSKPRLDEFGGGAAVVTSDAVRWMDTTLWVRKTINKIAAHRTSFSDPQTP